MAAPPPFRAPGPRVVVIGAGVVGLFCAFALARRGVSVTAIDAEPPAPHPSRAASAAAAGMLAPFSETMHEGPGHHRRLPELGAEALRAWRALTEQDSELRRQVRFIGATLLSHDDADAARVQRAADRARTSGSAAEIFDGLPPDLDPVIFGARVRTAARLPDEGVLAPRPTLARLREMAAAAGASLLGARTISDVELNRGETVAGVRFADGGSLGCDVIVMATGALAPPIFSVIAPALQKVSPAKGILGAAAAPLRVQLPDVLRTPRIYILKDGARLRFGSTSEVGRMDLDEDPDGIANMHLEVRRTVPGAKFPPGPTQVSAGLRPLTPDGAPIVGRSGPNGMFVAVGHSRNGWLFAPLTAEAIAAMIVGEEPAPIWSAFRPDRFG